LASLLTVGDLEQSRGAFADVGAGVVIAVSVEFLGLFLGQEQGTTAGHPCDLFRGCGMARL
jgi:hypothetical protein